MRHFLPFVLLALPSFARADAPTVTVSWPEQPGVGAPSVAITTPPPPPPPEEHHPDTAIAIDPVGIVTGAYAASLTHIVGDHVAIRGDLQYTRELYTGVPGSQAWSASIGIPVYLDRPFHGPFAELGIVARRSAWLGIEYAPDGMSSQLFADSFHAVGAQGFVGWQWTFRSGLHLSYAIGASRNWATGIAQPIVMAENDIRVGFAF